MALNVIRKTIEVERLVGSQETQLQVRAEALVPGAGRESVEVLMADGFASVTASEAQADRTVVSGNVFCQAAYRLGQEGGARALTAQAPIEQTIDMEEIAAFAKRVRTEKNAAESMREYARKHMSWEMEFERILNAVDGGVRP